MKKILNTLTSLMLLCALAMTLCVTTFAATPAAAAEPRTPVRVEEFQSSFFPEKLPANPLTSGAFLSVLLYAADNDLTEVVIPYTIPYQEGMKEQITEALKNALSASYKFPEYCNYLRRISYSTVADKDGFSIVLKLAAHDGDTAEMIERRHQANAKAAEIYSALCESGAITGGMSQKEIAKVLTRWVVDNTTYADDSTRISHTAYSVFFNKTGVCDGYTSALNLLLRQAGINCQGRKGHVGGVCHEWTIAILDGEVVNIDTTACESNFDHYFAVSDNAIAKTHVW